MVMTPTRRSLLKSAAFVPAAAAGATHILTASSVSPLYARLGVKPVINGVGVVTTLGGSIMAPEVIQAMEEASRFFIPLPELEKKVGARIAELLQAPAAMVTCGAASAIAVGTAACLSQGEASKLRQLPNRDGIRYEVIQQKSHRSGYEHQMELCGAKIVQLEVRAVLEYDLTPSGGAGTDGRPLHVIIGETGHLLTSAAKSVVPPNIQAVLRPAIGQVIDH